MSTPAGEGSARPRGLGKGLAALLGDVPALANAAAASRGETDGREAPTQLRMLPIDQLSPSPLQPRTVFDEAELEELAQSIRQNGILQPILVRQRGGGFEIIAGERRWRAAQRAGLHEMPAILRQLDDDEALELALVENLQREDLNPLEEAEAYQRLVVRFGHTQDAVAQAVGKSRSHIANMIRLLELPPYVKNLLSEGELSMGHARALLNARDPVGLADAIVSRGLNVRQVEAIARGASRSPRQPPKPRAPRDPNVKALEERLSASLGLKVTIESQPDGGGTMSFRFASAEQLDELLRRLEAR
jgi:ParB family chromosome partitioning protein